MNVGKPEYQEWRHHPVTKMFLQFIRDRRQWLITVSTESWLNGSISFEKENQIDRGRILELFDLPDLQFEIIEAFYKAEEEDAAKIDQDPPR